MTWVNIGWGLEIRTQINVRVCEDDLKLVQLLRLIYKGLLCLICEGVVVDKCVIYRNKLFVERLSRIDDSWRQGYLKFIKCNPAKSATMDRSFLGFHWKPWICKLLGNTNGSQSKFLTVSSIHLENSVTFLVYDLWKHISKMKLYFMNEGMQPLRCKRLDTRWVRFEEKFHKISWGKIREHLNGRM